MSSQAVDRADNGVGPRYHQDTEIVAKITANFIILLLVISTDSPNTITVDYAAMCKVKTRLPVGFG